MSWINCFYIPVFLQSTPHHPKHIPHRFSKVFSAMCCNQNYSWIRCAFKFRMRLIRSTCHANCIYYCISSYPYLLWISSFFISDYPLLTQLKQIYNEQCFRSYPKTTVTSVTFHSYSIKYVHYINLAGLCTSFYFKICLNTRIFIKFQAADVSATQPKAKPYPVLNRIVFWIS